MAAHTSHRAVKVDGLSIFDREAGRQDRPTLLLLHGLPSSSRMFEPLLTRLAGELHMVAPDYPGFGHSDAIPPAEFAYTFDNIAAVMTHFVEALNLSRYTLYMQDYGGPVGFRMALARPDRVEALIVQNAVAHDEGLGALWKTRRAFWADRAAHEAALRANLLSLEATRMRHVGHDPNPEKYNPDLWTDEYAYLTQSGQADIQTDLFYDYRTNVDAYPRWQAWMRERQPRLVVPWGRYDPSFDISEPEAYRRAFLAPRCTFSTRVTSPSTRRRTRSRRGSKPSWGPIPDTQRRLRDREDRVVRCAADPGLRPVRPASVAEREVLSVVRASVMLLDVWNGPRGRS